MKSTKLSQLRGAKEWDNEKESHLTFDGRCGFFLFRHARSSVACTQPPIQPAAVLHLETWPAYAGVGVMINNVPSLPATTAIGNWNSELNTLCGPGFGYGAGFFYSVTMSFTTLPPPANCPSGAICFTRGLTNFTNWDGSGRLKTAPMQINNSITSTSAMTEVIAHEFGHTMGLADCNYPVCSPGSSVMESGASIDVNGHPVTQRKLSYWPAGTDYL